MIRRLAIALTVTTDESGQATRNAAHTARVKPLHRSAPRRVA